MGASSAYVREHLFVCLCVFMYACAYCAYIHSDGHTPTGIGQCVWMISHLDIAFSLLRSASVCGYVVPAAMWVYVCSPLENIVLLV